MFLCGCNNNKVNNDPIIEINITEAQENKKDLKLSELVKKVEIIALESNVDCFIPHPINIHHFGLNYILALDGRRPQYYLFNGKGKFLRKIGQPGKGPGEYTGSVLACMDKNEELILVTDIRANKVIIYDVMGEVIAQKNLSNFLGSAHIMEVSGHFDNSFTILPHRPWEPRDGFASLLFFDFELNKVGEVLPRANDDDLCYLNLRHAGTFRDKKGAYFSEMYKDTLYQIYEDGRFSPKYRFIIDKNNLTKNVMKNREAGLDLYDYTFPLWMKSIPGYLIITNSGAGTVYFNLKSKEAFTLNEGIENDIFGLRPNLIRYQPEEKVCFDMFRWDDYTDYNDLTIIRNMEVSNPEIRDQLLEYAENPPDNLGAVVIVMHMK